MNLFSSKHKKIFKMIYKLFVFTLIFLALISFGSQMVLARAPNYSDYYFDEPKMDNENLEKQLKEIIFRIEHLKNHFMEVFEAFNERISKIENWRKLDYNL